ncbi:MAG: twin-arginine translocation pathway signal protein [Erythrobacter sp.]|nr:twin-arginine translocation pathway signal protein [Erythrobacter sp.]
MRETGGEGVKPNPIMAAMMLALCPLVASPALADTPAAAQEKAPFVAADFDVPSLAETPGFKLVPLGPALVDIDFAAYMSSIAHLQQTFTRSTGWPRADITAAEAMADMQTEEGRFERRESFAYAVLTPDGQRERGCIYVYPSTVPGHDAVIRLWVTKAEYDAGFDAELYAWAQQWIADEWPFTNAAFPGRATPWEEWDALVKASTAG